MKQSFGQKGAGGRFLALALALIMLCSVLAPAYAAAVDEQGAVENQNEPVPVGVTYIFHVGETVYQEVKVPSGSVLTKPEDPTSEEGMVFVCWQLADGQEFTSFETAVSTPQDETVNLYALFAPAAPANELQVGESPAQQPETPKPDAAQQPDPGATEDGQTPTGGENQNGNTENQPGENPTATDPEMPAEPEPANPVTGETALLTAQDYLDKIALYQADYNVLNLNKQIGLTTDEAYAESCQSLCLSLGDLLVQAADAQAAGTLTEDEFAQIEFDAETLLAEIGQSIGADQPELLAANQYTFTFNLTNIDVAYVSYSDPNNLTTGYFEETPEPFKGSSEAYMIFFLKPKEGYLLTDWRGNADKAFDFYSIDTPTSKSNIKNFTGVQEIVDQKMKEGYVGYFGFSRDSVSMNFTCTLIGEKPTLGIDATTTLNDVTPGRDATFTVTITPDGTSAKYDAKNLTIEELTINGKGTDGGVTYGTPEKQSDGTYTLTVTYPVTNEDFEAGTVELYVEASIEYKKTFTTKDRNELQSDITTGATVKNNATKKIPIVSNLRYIVRYEPEGVTPSNDVIEKTKAPVVDEKLSAGDEHTVCGYDRYQVEDTENNGTWTFDGWYLSGEKINPGDKYLMKEAQVTFYGKWTFTPNAVDVTIKKHVVGNLGDKAKKFKFTYTIVDKDGTDITPTAKEGDETAPNDFYLADGGQKTLTDIPIGAKVTITEEENSAYTTSWSYTRPDPENAEETFTVGQTGASLEFTVEKGMGEIHCTNKNETIPDTGVLLDSWPYVLILAVVAAGAVLTIARRRRDAD